MCGIAGIAGLTDVRQAKEAVDRMTRKIAHRGPDANSVLIGDGFAFGHARLSIIDLSDAANQPMTDASNRFIITFNGEIYNFRDVRARLPRYPFRTDSDTETILAAYIEWGPDCVEQLNGMFAFAIWDTHRRELFVARDRVGVKPFYYAIADGVLYFASEIRSVLASEAVARRVDRNGLADYLGFQSVYSPATIVEGVRQLPAGSTAFFRAGRLEITQYWTPFACDPRPPEEDSAGVRKRVLDLMLASVERRMVSDVPVGAFLSGGIDSSAVVALMSEVSGTPVNTFSVGFEEPEFDESEHALTIAKLYGTEHTSVRLRANDFLDALPDALAAADSPSGDGLNTFVVSRATREAGLKVALSGLGGDELFAGYPNFRNWFNYRTGLIAKTPGFVRRAAGAVVGLSSASRPQRLAAILNANRDGVEDFYPKTRQLLTDTDIREIAGVPEFRSRIGAQLAENAEAIARFPVLSQFSIGELLGYTQNVLLKDTDQFSMASALEVREPFFDFELVEYVLRIPDNGKFPAFPKSLLVESLSPRLPNSIVHRKKMGFVLPLDRWMRTELHDFCTARVRDLSEIVGNDAPARLWGDFLARRRGVLWSHVWHLVALSDWFGRHGFDSID